MLLCINSFTALLALLDLQIILGLGVRLLFKDIFYWTPAFYFGTHFNALDEPFFKLEILKFGARIG